MSLLNSKELHRIFEKVDKNGDGRVSLEELTWLLDNLHIQFSIGELESLVEKPGLDLDEFISFYFSISKPAEIEPQPNNGVVDEEEVVKGDISKAFEVFDLNGDGYISSEELESVLCRLGLWAENGGKDCKSMIDVYDTNLDGKLDFEEFKNMMLLDISS